MRVEKKNAQPQLTQAASSLIPHPSSLSPFSLWLERALVGALFLFAVAAPHSIALTQGAWMLAMLLWVARCASRPRPTLYRTPVDYALLGFFILTFVTALTSYEPDVSIGKLRAASLFTIVYVVAENVRDLSLLRRLAIALVASCVLGALYTFGAFAWGRGVKLQELNADSPLRAVGILEGDTLLELNGARLREPAAVARALAETGGGEPVRVRVYRHEFVPVVELPRGSLLAGETAEARLGIKRWTYGRDHRASGLLGQYTSYAEVLQLTGSLVFGLLVALRRKLSWRGALLFASFACLVGALLLTLTRAAWLALLVSAFVITLRGARRRTLLITAAVALPLVLAGLFVLQQKRKVSFIDGNDGSTTWRLMVYRDAARILLSEPRHLLVGVGMDSIKRRWREWDMFDGGRQPWGHLHSTPLQIAFERGLPTLFVWLALMFIYVRTLWRLARRATFDDWVMRGLALGALGGCAGFLTSGAVHYNWGDSESVMPFYFIMGLALAAERLTRAEAGATGAERET